MSEALHQVLAHLDGSTDAAGGIVDDKSAQRIRDAGMDPEAALADNDSYAALEAGGALLLTGPTGTNVNDLRVALIEVGGLHQGT